MGRLLFVVCVIVLFGYALTTLSISRGPLVIVPAAQSASVFDAATETQTDFNETGALVFYPNNIGPVPYIFYQDRGGNTAAKALVFPYAPPDGFSSWTGARISVSGHLDGEHVVVSGIVYISAP